jgi:hypothetical protein
VVRTEVGLRGLRTQKALARLLERFRTEQATYLIRAKRRPRSRL